MFYLIKERIRVCPKQNEYKRDITNVCRSDNSTTLIESPSFQLQHWVEDTLQYVVTKNLVQRASQHRYRHPSRGRPRKAYPKGKKREQIWWPRQEEDHTHISIFSIQKMPRRGIPRDGHRTRYWEARRLVRVMDTWDVSLYNVSSDSDFREDWCIPWLVSHWRPRATMTVWTASNPPSLKAAPMTASTVAAMAFSEISPAWEIFLLINEGNCISFPISARCGLFAMPSWRMLARPKNRQIKFNSIMKEWRLAYLC